MTLELIMPIKQVIYGYRDLRTLLIMNSNNLVATRKYLKKHYYYAAVMHTDPVYNVLNQGKTTID